MMQPSHRVALIAAFALLIPVAGRAADTPQASGDLWEVTSKMSMEGAPVELPGQTRQVCAPKEWKEPPAPSSERQQCKVSDFALAGGKATWKVSCSDPEMTGQGEITRDGTEAFAGAIKMTGAQGSMTIKLKGKRLGDCDPAQK